MIRTTLKTLESRTTQFSFTYSRRAQSSWIPPSKRRSVRYGSCSTTSTSTATQQQQQQHQSQRRPVVVNGKTLPFHVNDLKKTQHQHQHHVATTTTSSSSFSSQQQHNKNGSSNNNNIKPLRKYESDLIVVLDMDECLIHSQFLQDSPGAKYAHQVQQRSGGGDGGDGEKSSSSSTNSVDTFNITLPDGERVLVHKRPYLHEFLKEVSSKYETHIFTAAMEVYAKPVLNILDPHGDIFTNIYYRESCQLNSTVGAYVKNLGGLGLFCDDDSDSHSNNNENTNNNKRRLNRTVLVDNNPLSFLANPDNGILVSSFYDDSRDTTLPAVMDLIHELDEHEDVRPVLDARFQLREALNDISLGRPFSGRQQQIDQQQEQQQQQQQHEQQHERIALATAS